jgi:hypothetical protein
MGTEAMVSHWCGRFTVRKSSVEHLRFQWSNHTQLAHLAHSHHKSKGKPCVGDRHVQTGIVFSSTDLRRYAEHTLNLLQAVERLGCLRPNDSRICNRIRRTDHCEDPCDLFETLPNGDQQERGHAEQSRLIGRTRGDMHRGSRTVCDGQGHPLDPLVTAGPVCDHIGTRAMPGSLPDVGRLLVDHGRATDWSA